MSEFLSTQRNAKLDWFYVGCAEASNWQKNWLNLYRLLITLKFHVTEKCLVEITNDVESELRIATSQNHCCFHLGFCDRDIGILVNNLWEKKHLFWKLCTTPGYHVELK